VEFVENWDSLSWAALAARVLGVALAIALLAGLRRRFSGTTEVGASAALVAALLAAWLVVPTLRGQARDLSEFRDSNAGKVEAEKNFACTTQALIDRPFFEWAKRKMGPGARYHLAIAESTRQVDGQFCIRLIMLPATEARTFEEAGWAIFYEDLPGPDVKRVARRGGRYITPDPANPDRALVELDP